ncbi:LOG family protein [Pseudohoeflea coraliihabitans]|uniref:AMP nucleosidase n=1 Tax=Pseudohoeflea coraliihabitans TaxID=2860393 RepID=A0ABS6WRA3_9HYPH|nr:LOG family protein [Pseudohoeflea sp. DP4N28-3]MBW3097575.1 LOG family protein [Pseudohoeflea sp. DP4N28-3]
MNARRPDGTWDPLSDSHSDRERAERQPVTPQTESPAYRLAYADMDFLCREELRPVRLQLELLKAGMMLEEHGVKSTVVMFGGARIPEPGGDPWAAKNEIQAKNLTAAARYYEEARNFARICSQHSLTHGGAEYVICTGGGPGVMEAGNRGACDAGADSIGLNIILPHEQAPNEYVTPELSFNFHYFAIRKMHFLIRAKAITIFPGGFGTMDELFETLTLIQTGRMERIPLLLFGKEFWSRMIDFEALAEFGTISPDDTDLIRYVDTAEEAWKAIAAHYRIP